MMEFLITGPFTAVWRIQTNLYCFCECCFLVFTHVLSVRHAIEVNKRDYRAWYGLGQTYEILKMPFYCLYYYRKAHQLRYGFLKKCLLCLVQIFLGQNVSKRAMFIICFDLLWCIFVGPMTRACWSHWVKATKNCHSKWKPRRYACGNRLCNKFTKVSGLFLIYTVTYSVFV